MKRRVLAALIPVLTLGFACGCGRASEPAARKRADAVQILRQMSDRLAQASQLTFTATRRLDPALLDGIDVPEAADIQVMISRPNRLQATATASSGVRRFYADGQNITLSDDRMLLYATVPLMGSIDDVIDRLDETYGFVPPLAEFAANDPYRRFEKHIQRSVYRSTDTIDGVACDHVALTGSVADADLWVSSSDHLPRRFVATFKDRDGQPQLRIDFSQWNLKAALQDSVFVFTPADGAQRITMRAVADVKPE
jgi:hypothetical protein